MQRHCQSCDSAIINCRMIDSAVASHQQCCHMINSAVASHWRCCHINDGTVTWSTALSHDWQHCRIMWQCCPWCVGAVNVMQQHCWSCNSAVVDVKTLSMSCDSTVHHAITWLTALSRDRQHSHVHNSYVEINNKVVERTVLSLNWQWLCCNCVSWFALAYSAFSINEDTRQRSIRQRSGCFFTLLSGKNIPQQSLLWDVQLPWENLAYEFGPDWERKQ
jgi:hypothetical protein